MPNVSEMFPSPYFRAADLPKKGLNLVIDEVAQEEVSNGDEKQLKWALRFKAENRALILNKTNASILSEACGAHTDNWRGKTVTLGTVKVSFAGKMTDGIRVTLLDFDDDVLI